MSRPLRRRRLWRLQGRRSRRWRHRRQRGWGRWALLRPTGWGGVRVSGRLRRGWEMEGRGEEEVVSVIRGIESSI